MDPMNPIQLIKKAATVATISSILVLCNVGRKVKIVTTISTGVIHTLGIGIV